MMDENGLFWVLSFGGILIHIFFIMITIALAVTKNRNVLFWGSMAVLFSPITLILLLFGNFLPKFRKDAPSPQTII